MSNKCKHAAGWTTAKFSDPLLFAEDDRVQIEDYHSQRRQPIQAVPATFRVLMHCNAGCGQRRLVRMVVSAVAFSDAPRRRRRR